jgi:exonuclease I
MQRAMWLVHEQKALTPPADFKLGTLTQYFGVRLRPEDAHDALHDVRATVALYRAIACCTTFLPIAPSSRCPAAG